MSSASSSTTQPVLLMLVDISGYTRFMVEHEKEVRHSQTIIGELLESLRFLIQETVALDVGDDRLIARRLNPFERVAHCSSRRERPELEQERTATP